MPQELSTKKEKVKFIIDTLECLYPDPSIPLNYTDSYSFLIAVLLSAQCKDERVNKITPLLFQTAATPHEMSLLSISQIENIIYPCGLASAKSKAIWNLSKIILEKHSGKIPNNFNDLEALPGVGHKTASVVMSQIFNIPSFPVDTHIHRLMYRWNLSNGKSVVQTEKDAKKTFPIELWNKLHLQIIYYAREYSPARGLKIENDIIFMKIGRKSELKKYL